ncbi:MAG: hypothetical protein IPI67_42325 [Myxococcales bacterium]|nr:hypothetical protein [Myxococcales bacterium]
MTPVTSLSNDELLARAPLARFAERNGTAEVIAYLAEIDRRRLYLRDACSSLHTFCVERLGYSEEEAAKRIKVARLCRRLPRVVGELEGGAIHLTGLYLLAPHLTHGNADALLGEARGKTRREIEALLARWFPRSDVLPTITPLDGSGSWRHPAGVPGNGGAACAGPGNGSAIPGNGGAACAGPGNGGAVPGNAGAACAGPGNGGAIPGNSGADCAGPGNGGAIPGNSGAACTGPGNGSAIPGNGGAACAGPGNGGAIPGNSGAACTGPGNGAAIPGNSARPTTATQFRLEPLSASSYRVEFTASAELYGKLQRARNLLSHSIPNGDLATLFERALDELLAAETKRRFGSGKPRKPRKARAPAPGSRHVPVEVARIVWERDGGQCAFVDERGRRCSEQRFVTLEHKHPFARGGPTTAENLCLLCSAHNAEAAREVYGEAFLEQKRADKRAARDQAKHADAAAGIAEPKPADKRAARDQAKHAEPAVRSAEQKRADGRSARDHATHADAAAGIAQQKLAVAALHDKVQGALVWLGFEPKRARAALNALRKRGVEPEVDVLLREAVVALTA